MMATFRSLFRLLRSATSNNRITRKERQSITLPTQPHLAAITTEVLQSDKPKQSFDSLFRGKNPAGTDQSNLFPVDELTGVTFASVEQGVWGSCAVLAAALNERNFWTNPNRTTTFRFFDSARPVYITVTNQRQISGARGFGGIVERAYAAYLDKTDRVRDGLTAWDEMAEGNQMDEVISAFTGRPATTINGLTNNLDILRQRIDNGQTVLFAQHESNQWISPVHAYRVVSVGTDTVTLKDPRGWDLADGVKDGFQVVPFSAFAERAVFSFG